MYRDLLDGVHFVDGAAASPLLTRAGFRHGFEGKEATSSALRRHHLRQVHSTLIVDASADNGPDATDRQEADGLCTAEPGMTIAVKTADCLPVLIADKERRFVMAVHAGWRGLTAGILDEAVTRALSHGGDPAQLVVAIGPAISREIYEVGPEVIDALAYGRQRSSATAAGLALAVAKGRGDRWHLDTAIAAIVILSGLGIPGPQIEVMHACTFREADRWHSYRRRQSEGGVGAIKAFNWAWIEL